MSSASSAKTSRPTWDEYFINLVDAAAARASCDRGRSGAVFTRDNDVLTTGYVGAPPGLPDCYEAGHLMQRVTANPAGVSGLPVLRSLVRTTEHCVRTIHAEQNGILRAARNGVSLRGATVYCTLEPCVGCAMSLVALEVVRVVAKNRYHAADRTRALFAETGVRLDVLVDVETYDAAAQSFVPWGMTLGSQCSGLTKCSEFARTGYAHTEACCLLEGDA